MLVGRDVIPALFQLVTIRNGNKHNENSFLPDCATAKTSLCFNPAKHPYFWMDINIFAVYWHI